MIGEKSEKQKLSRIEMMECAFLDPIDYDKRVILGKCPKTPDKKFVESHLPDFLRQKIKKLDKKRISKHSSAKRRLLKAVFIGKKSFYAVELRNINVNLELIEGLYLILRCSAVSDQKNAKEKMEWFINGIKLTSQLNWRININSENELVIWPLLSGLDDGKYECYEDHESKGAVSLHIISVKANIFFHRMQFLIQSIIQNSKFHK
ncbi:unnamed protein product [Dracunculus medinensis]|uniref:Ig-like domain-containing protein n=1 Tax=Dracunculus medinensis TaxID=318479 RepID=A0A0N4UG50_DRAME|nr:unnamed protein product [Dracunculus medinensis]